MEDQLDQKNIEIKSVQMEKGESKIAYTEFSNFSAEAEKKNRRLFNKFLLFFFILFLVGGSYWFGYSRGKEVQIKESSIIPFLESSIKNETNKDIDFSIYWKVWDILKEKYVDKNELDPQKLIYGSIKGMLAATGDPYSNFFDPKETKDFSQDMEGSFEGIGAELGMKDGILTVIAPLEDSPSQKAGLRTGDKILKVEDKSTMDMSIDAAVDMIRGKKGTDVKLTVLHEGDQETKEVIVTRDKIEIKSVKMEMKENGIAYVKIIKFSDETSKEFSNAAKEIISSNMRGIIIDLRNNPGGYLDKAVNIANLMIPKGKIIVSEEDNSGKRDSVFSTGGDKLSSTPAVVLINEGSASASEILAGALRDNQNIQLIGKKTFGKGSVQELINLPEKASVKITVAKWLTPNGDYIMEKGINPDIEVELSNDDYDNNRDPQLDKALEIIKEKIE